MDDETHANPQAVLPVVTAPQAAPELSESVPQIEGYHVIGTVGQGGMGTVWRAVQLSTRRDVALKVLTAAGFASRKARLRFNREVELTARLEHPNIARIYDSGVHYSLYFYAMELVRGPGDRKALPLTEHAEDNKLSVRQRLELLATVADAVHYAHQKGVIHRDLKPANVLVDESGRPKVLDFGVARATDITGGTTHADVGQLIGTLSYMSPEQTTGDPAQLDTRSDVYALGVIGYELLSGRLPCAGAGVSAAEAVRLIREQEPSRLGTLDKGLRGDVETIIDKALAKERERRYQSAAELASDVQRYLNDEPIAARPRSARYQLVKFARRNKLVVAGAAAAVLSLVIGTVATTWAAVRAFENAKRAAQRQHDAEMAEAAARRRFQQLLATATSFLFEFDGQIAGVIGTTSARERLVDRALELLDGLARDVPDDPHVQRDLAIAYGKLAQVLGDPWQPNLNQPDKAIQAYRRGLALTQKLAAAHFDDTPLLESLALLYELIAKLECHRGDGRAATAALEQDITLSRQLVERHPQSLLERDNLAAHLADAGTVHMLLGNLPTALRLQREAVTISCKLTVEHPGTRRFQFTLAHVFGTLGETQRFQSKWGDSLGSYQQAVSVLEPLARERPSDQRVQGNLLVVLNSLTESQLRVGRPTEAEQTGSRAVGLATALVTADPKNAWARRLLAHAVMIHAEALTTAGRPAEGVEATGQALDICRTRMRADPGDVQARRDLWYGYWSFAEALAAQAAAPHTDDHRRAELWRQARFAYICSRDVAAESRRRRSLIRPELELVQGIPESIRRCTQQLLACGGVELDPVTDPGAPAPAGLGHFRIEYPWDDDEPGGRTWRQVDDSRWVQRKEISGRCEVFQRVGRLDEADRHGIVVRGVNGRREILIPDLNGKGWVESRATHQDEWRELAEPHSEE